MQTRGDQILAGFFVLGVASLLLGMVYGPDSSRDFSGEVNSQDNSSLEGQVFPDSTAIMNGIMPHEGFVLDAQTATRLKLPKRLKEISGLAMTADSRLLAHNDEEGIVFEIDYHDGTIIKSFTLTDHKAPVAADFEGIATAEGSVYLVTSSGRVYECREGNDKEAVLFNVYTTGIGRDYEIEGLAYEPNRRALLLMAKNPRSPDHEGLLTVYIWSIDTKQLVENAHIVLNISDFSNLIKSKNFHPSGIERHPQTGNYFIVAARESAIAEISPTGDVISVMPFPAKWHRQAEGITFLDPHTLIVSDEGAGKRARLTLYPISQGRQ